MLIECILHRPGGSHIDIAGTIYHFVPVKKDGPHVAEVTDPAHIQRFLSIAEGYRRYPDRPIGALMGIGRESKAPIQVLPEPPEPQVIDPSEDAHEDAQMSAFEPEAPPAPPAKPARKAPAKKR